jgi:hypothetical protein
MKYVFEQRPVHVLGRKMSESTEYRLRVAIFVATITFVLHFFFHIG